MVAADVGLKIALKKHELFSHTGFDACREVERQSAGSRDEACIPSPPISVKLGRRVGRTRVERRCFLLRHFPDLALKLRGLIESDPPFHAGDADGFEQPQGSDRVGARGVFRCLETHLHMGLRGVIIDFGRLGLLDDADEVGGVGQLAMTHEKPRALLVGIDIEMIDPPGVE
jgi:hypothetical protein